MTTLFRGEEGEWGLQSVRYYLLTDGFNPSVHHSWTRDGPVYTKLSYKRKCGTVVIQAAQQGWTETQAFAEAFSEAHTDVPFHMQTRGMLTHEALLLRLKPKRAWISDSRRTEIARIQKTCIKCNEDLSNDYEIDHVQPLASFGATLQRTLSQHVLPAMHRNPT